MSDWKPWEEYPELWKNKTAFFTYLRGSLRKAVWDISPIKISFKNSTAEKPPKNYMGKGKKGKICALSGEWFPISYLEVDHIEGNVSLNDEEDILDFIKHLVPPKGSLQLVSKEAHKVKSYAEKQKISYKEAKAEKFAISLIKDRKDTQFLVSNNITPEKSAPKRRKQIVRFLLDNY